MSRGSQTLFQNIFIETVEKPEKQRKGRSVELDSRRNECLIDRYFFYGKFSDMRYEKILSELSKEFFISTVTIPKVVDANLERLVQLKKNKPEKNYFKNKWPHLVW